MKIVEGISGSKIRINDDKTIDFCLIEEALPQQESGEYAFLTKSDIDRCANNEPIFSLVRLYDLEERATFDEDAISKLLEHMVENAIAVCEWQSLCTCFDDIENDMQEVPEFYREYE